MVLGFLEVFSVMGAKDAIFILAGVAFACWVAVNGWLLVFRPDLFLRFLDWQNPGDYWSKTASWRKDVYNAEYKALGVVFFMGGLFLLGLLARILLKI